MRILLRAAPVVAVAIAATVHLSTVMTGHADPGGPSTRIVGGTPAPDSYTFAARLEVAGTGQLLCSAWVHTDLRVVTGAHCVTAFPTTARPELLAAARTHYGWWAERAGLVSAPGTPAAYQVRVGANPTSGRVVPVAAIRTGAFAWGRPDAAGRVNDVASLRVAELITTPRALRAPAPRVGAEVRVTGFGVTAPGGPIAARLMMSDTHRVPDNECAAGGIGRDEMCLAPAPGGGGGCNGDSGGPLLHMLRMAGHEMPAVVGWASRAGTPAPCGQSHQIMVNLAHHKRWLDQQARADGPVAVWPHPHPAVIEAG